MKRLRTQGLTSRQDGFSLLELLIATTIGLVVTLGAIAVFANSTSDRQTTGAQSLMNEDAQAALSLLSREIKMAGYEAVIKTPPSLGLRGCSGLFRFDANSVNDDKLRCEIGGTSQPHSLVVSYEADEWNTVRSKSKSLPTDCLGTGLENKKPARNRYYIDFSRSSGTPNLFCQGNGGSGSAPPQPMVDNIEDLKLSFGTATIPVPAPAASASTSAVVVTPSAPASPPKTSEPTKLIAGYLSATEVEKLAPSQSKSDIESAWNQVLTVQICIVVRSEAKNLVSDNVSAIYTKCDGTLDTSQTDRRLRRAFTTTVALRNRLNLPTF